MSVIETVAPKPNWVCANIYMPENIMSQIPEIKSFKTHLLFPDDFLVTQIVTESLDKSLIVRDKLSQMFPNEDFGIMQDAREYLTNPQCGAE